MGFDELAAAGRAAVLSGEHQVESPPEAEASRWGPSVILRPDAESRERIERWVSELLPIVGPGHWATGLSKSAHITVRTLGPRRPAEEEAAFSANDVAAVTEAARRVGSVSFGMGRILLSPISVMLALHPVDQEATHLAAALEEALGVDGWFEKGRSRDIWYLNLIHFTGPIADPSGLAKWVTSRNIEAPPVHAETIEIVSWNFDGQQMVPRKLAALPLGGIT